MSYVHPSLKAAFETIKPTLQGTFVETLGIEFYSIMPEEIRAKVAITPQLLQPFGFLHGGVALGISETLASIGAYLHIDTTLSTVFGQYIHANHLRPIKNGVIIACACAIYLGKRSQVWETRIQEEKTSKLLSISQCTLAIVDKK
jgi:1,4-dihydroxy-2-naphthoyl-CoA hydrolase